MKVTPKLLSDAKKWPESPLIAQLNSYKIPDLIDF